MDFLVYNNLNFFTHSMAFFLKETTYSFSYIKVDLQYNHIHVVYKTLKRFIEMCYNKRNWSKSNNY